MRTKLVITLLIVMAMTLSIVSVVRADSLPQGVATGTGNIFDPSQMTQADKDKLAAKIKLADSNMKALTGKVTPADTTILSVGAAETYREPNTWAYRNYCVPSSTQVAIRARTSNVPSLDTVATGEYTDPASGTNIYNATAYINSYLGTGWYVSGKATSSTQFSSWLLTDMGSSWSLMTLLETNGMPGWGSYVANHFVATYGDIHSGSTVSTVYFVDTASETAGHHYSSGGSYFETGTLTAFWTWITNDSTYGEVW